MLAILRSYAWALDRGPSLYLPPDLRQNSTGIRGKLDGLLTAMEAFCAKMGVSYFRECARSIVPMMALMGIFHLDRWG
jgi:hypothetical protein